MRLDTRPFRLLIVCLALMPALFTLWLILNYGVDVPYWDEWVTAVLIERFFQGTLTVADLFARNNEYIQFFPNLIFVLLGWLTRWDPRYGMLLSFVLACLVSFNIYRLAQTTSPGGGSRSLVQFVLANLFIFTPMQYENWLMGIQIIYFIPIVCITTCLRITCSDRTGRVKFITCSALATISTFSSVNGILCWVVVLPVFLRWQSLDKPAEKDWKVVAWIAGFALCATLYFSIDGKIALGFRFSDQPLVHLRQALAYFLALLGAPLAIGPHPIFVAVSVGAAVLLLILFSWNVFLRLSTNHVIANSLIVWLMIGTYSVITAAMVTAGRMHYGVGQSLSSRYTTFSLYLMVSLVYLVPIIVDGSPSILTIVKKETLRRLVTVAATFVVVAHLIVFPLAIKYGVNDTAHRRLYGKACLVLIDLVADDCNETLYPDLAELRNRAHSLDRLGLLRPPLFKSDRVKDLEAAEVNSSATFGSFENLEKQDENRRVASGWASVGGMKRPPDAVILAYENDQSDFIVFALAEMDFENAILQPQPQSGWRWRKSFPLNRLPTLPTKVNAWAFDAKAGRAYRLVGEKLVE